MLLYCRAGAPQNLYYIISAEKFLLRMCSANLKHDFINITIFPNTAEWNNKTSPTVWIYRVLWESWCWYICTDFLCLLVVHWDLHQQAGFSLLLVHHHSGWETVCLILFLQASWGSPERQHQSQHRAGSWWPAIWNYSPGCHRITECSTRTKWQCHGTEGSLQIWMEKVTVCVFIPRLLVNIPDAPPTTHRSKGWAELKITPRLLSPKKTTHPGLPPPCFYVCAPLHGSVRVENRSMKENGI